jgi:hypothetical protein
MMLQDVTQAVPAKRPSMMSNLVGANPAIVRKPFPFPGNFSLASPPRQRA